MSRVIFSFLILAIVATGFHSCTPPDYSAQVATIDSLVKVVDSSYSRFSAVSCDSLQAIQDSVNSHLEYIQKEYEGPMIRSMGEHLGKYRSVRKLVPDARKRKAAAEEEYEKTKLQLTNLRTALTDGSTHDATGNKFTPEYVKQLLATEKNAASALCSELNLIADRSPEMISRFNELNAKVRFWVDSIPLKKEDDLLQ